GPGQGERIAELLTPTLGNATVHPVVGGTLDSALELGNELKTSGYDAVVGIGGGRTLDTAKYAASRYGLPMVSVPTSLAHDGIASPVATLDYDGERPSYGVAMPIAVVVDLDFVGDAPDRHTRSGIGDALSNLNAVADWELAHREIGEPIDGLAVALARNGAEALLHHPGTITDDGFLITLAEALTLGGIAMGVCGSSRPASGGCHEISHALDHLARDAGTHGEQVGMGALVCTFLRGDQQRFDQLSACLGRHGLPRIPSDIGLTQDQLVAAVLDAPDTRPGRYTILEHLALGPEELRARIKEYVDAVG
ncbi:MAG: iron-containing alcohol dehydrogenase family protein, partial [Micromonosporaceae bacterium]